MKKLGKIIVMCIIVLGAMLMLGNNEAIASTRTLDIRSTRPYVAPHNRAFSFRRGDITYNMVKIFDVSRRI